MAFFGFESIDPYSFAFDPTDSVVLLLIGLVALVIIFALTKKFFVFDSRFLKTALPFIVAAVCIRVLTDLQFLPYSGNPLKIGFYTHTPGLWLGGAAIALLLFFVLQKISNKNAFVLLEKIGWLFAASLLAVILFNFRNVNGFLLVALISFVLAFAWIAVQRVTKIDLLKNSFNFFAYFTSMLDASASIVAFNFLFCTEKHFSTALLLKVSPFLLVAVKIFIILVLLAAIEKFFKTGQVKNFSKIFLILFGIVTGLRTALFIGAGLCG